jgi:CRISPR/Cas system-associated exonuclease Cas4 (RecB family)
MSSRTPLGAKFQPAPGLLVLSASRLKDFATCRHRYFLARVLQLRVGIADVADTTELWEDLDEPMRRRSFDGSPNGATVGLWVHEELEARHAAPETHHNEEPVIKDRPDDASAARAVHRHLDLCPGQDGARYLGGELDLRWFHPGKSVLLTGRVDALWQHDDGVIEVRDYKTGRTEDLAADVAVEIYALLAAAHYPGKSLRITYEFLGDRVEEESQRTQSVEVTRALLLQAKNRVDRIADDIRREQSFPATPNALHCRQCPYRQHCHAAQLSP